MEDATTPGALTIGGEFEVVGTRGDAGELLLQPKGAFWSMMQSLQPL